MLSHHTVYVTDFSSSHLCVCVCEHGVPQRVCRGQRTTDRSQLFPSTGWDLGIELTSSGLAADPFTH